MAAKGVYCDGIRRRDFLRMGSAGIFGSTLTLPALLAAQARAADAGSGQGAAVGASDKSLIVVFLKGGLSTIDTWDLKPHAPAEIRGEFDPISTNVPGIELGDLMPLAALQMDKFSLVRSFGHRNSDHGAADHYMLTGYHPLAGFNAGLTPNNQRPSHGSILAKRLGPRGSIPPYVCLPEMHPAGGSAYLGPSAAPFSVNADPSDPGFTVRDVVPPLDLDLHRIDSRKDMLAQLDRFQRTGEAKANQAARSVDVFRRKAFDLMTSAAAREAFDIHREKEKLRDEYGRNTLGQSCLMARRLVEAGVRCSMIYHVDWDTHSDNFTHLRRDLMPLLDPAMATLFRDLSERGLLDKTLVLVTGEFGRTPRINKDAGRDHWGPGFTIAIGGGGLKNGIVVGKSDARAEKSIDRPYGPEDLAATVHHVMGVDPNAEFYTPEGRPIKIVNDGRIIRELT